MPVPGDRGTVTRIPHVRSRIGPRGRRLPSASWRIRVTRRGSLSKERPRSFAQQPLPAEENHTVSHLHSHVVQQGGVDQGSFRLNGPFITHRGILGVVCDLDPTYRLSAVLDSCELSRAG